jgi:hypothetical protein
VEGERAVCGFRFGLWYASGAWQVEERNVWGLVVVLVVVVVVVVPFRVERSWERW